jgi:hypothetical protein
MTKKPYVAGEIHSFSVARWVFRKAFTGPEKYGVLLKKYSSKSPDPGLLEMVTDRWLR